MAARFRAAGSLALVALLTLAGCSGPSEPPLQDESPFLPVGESPGVVGEAPAEFVDAAVMQVEFRDEVFRLEWPPGMVPPERAPEQPPMPDTEGVMRGNTYEVGYGRSVAGDFWICAWGREWLAQRGKDEAREAAALAQLNTLKQMYFYRATLTPDGQMHWDEILRQVNLGDPTRIANHVTVNCAGI